jgi:hypothetical protein
MSEHYKYVAVRVGSREKHPLEQASFKVIKLAVFAISKVMNDNGDWWRVVEIPPGEDLDYDGTVVAEIKTGRLW